MTFAQTVALLAYMPAPHTIKLALGTIVLLLGAACIYYGHTPRRDRGGFAP